MVVAHGRFKFEKLAKYPHMKPADIEIWERFIAANPKFFDTVNYDFHVGKGADFLPDDESTAEGRENRLYRKKIDVVGYFNDNVWIIEVKPEADMLALGQVLTYKKIYIEERGPDLTLTLAVVCGNIAKEMEAVFKEHSILIYAV